MNEQSVFKGLGSNWKWASVTGNGYVRVHTVEPTVTHDGILQFDSMPSRCSRCPAHDLEVTPKGMEPVIWSRTDFENGPTNCTDAYGVPTGHTPAPAVQYASANAAVSVGVAATACRLPPVAAPAPAMPPEAGMPMPPTKGEKYPIRHRGGIIQYSEETFVWHDEAGMQGGVAYTLDDAFNQQHHYAESLNGKGVIDADTLGQCKARALRLTQRTDDKGRSFLTDLQYMAIFGEFPE